MRCPRHVLVILCLAWLPLVPVAQAGNPINTPLKASNSPNATAKAAYERGQKLFALQRFEEALKQFELAFDAQPIPDFLFNIGQCQRNLRDYDAAIFTFKRFLELVPDSPNRHDIEIVIAELEAKKPTGTCPLPLRHA